MSKAGLKPIASFDPRLRVGVLLPLPLGGAYDYKLPKDCNAPRGTVVSAPFGNRQIAGVVWGAAQGTVGDDRLKEAVPLEGLRLPNVLCDFIDWVAHYTMNRPGALLAMALRARGFAAQTPRIAYMAGGVAPGRLSLARVRALEIASDGLARSVSSLAEDANVSPAVVRGLVKAGALLPTTLPEFAPFAAPDPEFAAPRLSEEQESAAASLREAVRNVRFSASLLDGVTGSGKTEVYFEAVAEALRQNKQILILLPEIALTVQFLERFADRFGTRPAQWHSDLTQKERRRVWRAVLSGEVKVVVGARSALFLPFFALGLVIVDEEHEQAFKQQDGAIYHARDMAVVRARIEGCAAVLASATPSLETYVNALAGRYAHLTLPSRHGASMPQVRLIDLRAETMEAGQWISSSLRGALTETLAAGEQAMLFLNRRGYAPLTLCEACGHKITCPNCAAWLVEHRYKKRLLCHHCGHESGVPQTCPACSTADSLIACGPGVERVAEEFASAFPDARYAIASSDLLEDPAAAQSAIRAMSRREIDVLIGTQIVAKGHHFPQLTLVGVIDGDLGGSEGDPRARERTFQLLHQVSGRAGRADKPGLVLIQTRNPSDPVMRALVSGDRDGFYEQERVFRERSGTPPFGRLAAIILSGPDAAKVQNAARNLSKVAPQAKDVKVWGPAPAFYAVLRGQTRERLLVQAARNVDIQAYLRTWLALAKIPSGERVTIDIDPVSFF